MKPWRQLRARILASYTPAILLLLVVCIGAIVGLYRLGQASDAILQENYRSILAAENMAAAIERQNSAVLASLFGYEPQEAATFGAATFESAQIDFFLWLNRAKDNVTIAAEPATLATIETTYLVYLQAQNELRLLQAADAQQALAYYYETVFPLHQQVRTAANDLRDINQHEMTVAAARAQRLSRQAILFMTVLGATAVFIGLLFSLLLTNYLARPLQAMTAATERIAAGDYDVTLDIQTDDELGHLAAKIGEMSQKLKSFHELNVGKLLAEKQRSEAILSSISDGVILVDHNLIIQAINPKAAEIFSGSYSQTTGRHLFDVIENPELYERIRQVTDNQSNGASQTAVENAAALTLTRGETVHHYHCAITPVKTERNQILGVVLLLQDVTKLVELDRLKSDFIMTASHELRTPLTGMAMSIGLLNEQVAAQLGEKERELLRAAQTDVERLRALVDNLLDLSKLESGRISMELEAVDMAQLVENVVDLLRSQAAEKEIELTWQLPAGTPPVLADANKIVWVLTNLAANALRYTSPQGHIHISGEARRNTLYLSVKDDGAGIPLEYQSKIFDKFVQVKGAAALGGAAARGGAGLGLAISKEIIKAHKGAIWVTSTPGEGSVFTFTLPLAVPQEE
jgi:two-component system, NtrC family, sensor histidine kinase KinB